MGFILVPASACGSLKETSANPQRSPLPVVSKRETRGSASKPARSTAREDVSVSEPCSIFSGGRGLGFYRGSRLLYYWDKRLGCSRVAVRSLQESRSLPPQNAAATIDCLGYDETRNPLNASGKEMLQTCRRCVGALPWRVFVLVVHPPTMRHATCQHFNIQGLWFRGLG